MIRWFRLTLDESFAPCHRRHKSSVYIDPRLLASVGVRDLANLTPTDRCLAASSLFEAARAIIESSLPSDLTIEERRLTAIERLYKGELPEEALLAHANYIAPMEPAITE
jgi:hypothetical protein